MLELCTGKAKTLVAHVKLCVEDADEHISQYPHAAHRKGWQPLKTKHTYGLSSLWQMEHSEMGGGGGGGKGEKAIINCYQVGVTHLVNMLIVNKNGSWYFHVCTYILPWQRPDSENQMYHQTHIEL